MKNEVFKTILNYNKDHSCPRGIHKEHLIHFIKARTSDDEITISRKLDILFGVKNKSARKQMLFTLFLILNDSKIESLLNMNYKQSIPNKDQLDTIKQIGIEYYSNIDSKTILRSFELIFNPSYMFEPINPESIQIEDITPIVEFSLLVGIDK